jgi:hypothetical protein
MSTEHDDHVTALRLRAMALVLDLASHYGRADAREILRIGDALIVGFVFPHVAAKNADLVQALTSSSETEPHSLRARREGVKALRATLVPEQQ